MLFARLINWILWKLFGVYASDGSQTARIHYINDNCERTERWKIKGWPYMGRIFFWWKGREVFNYEWHLWSLTCGFGVGFGGECHDKLKIHFAVPPFSFYWGFRSDLVGKFMKSQRLQKWSDRFGGRGWKAEYSGFHLFDIRIFDKAIWWDFLRSDWGWSREMPKWMHGCWHPLDTIFGKMKYTKTVLGHHEVQIPMPEGRYPGTVEMDYCTWKRPRLPWYSQKSYSAYVAVDVGIPHEGKGESEYNCGEDALFGVSRGARTVEEAIAAMVQAVLEARRKYNGNRDVVYPTPAERIAAVHRLRAASRKEQQNQQAEAAS